MSNLSFPKTLLYAIGALGAITTSTASVKAETLVARTATTHGVIPVFQKWVVAKRGDAFIPSLERKVEKVIADQGTTLFNFAEAGGVKIAHNTERSNITDPFILVQVATCSTDIALAPASGQDPRLTNYAPLKLYSLTSAPFRHFSTKTKATIENTCFYKKGGRRISYTDGYALKQ